MPLQFQATPRNDQTNFGKTEKKGFFGDKKKVKNDLREEVAKQDKAKKKVAKKKVGAKESPPQYVNNQQVQGGMQENKANASQKLSPDRKKIPSFKRQQNPTNPTQGSQDQNYLSVQESEDNEFPGVVEVSDSASSSSNSSSSNSESEDEPEELKQQKKEMLEVLRKHTDQTKKLLPPKLKKQLKY